MTKDDMRDWAMSSLRLRTKTEYSSNSVILYLEVQNDCGGWETISEEYIFIPREFYP